MEVKDFVKVKMTSLTFWPIKADDFLAEMLGSQSIASKAKRRRRDGHVSPTLEISRVGDEDYATDGVAEMNGHAGPSKKNVDDLLPIGVSAVSCATARIAVDHGIALTMCSATASSTCA